MNKKHTKKPLRVGFDLDGVILYNPIRMGRPLVAFVKKYILKKTGVKFYIPQSKSEKALWWLIHKTSFIAAPGLEDIIDLIQKHNIEAFIITARFGSLKDDFERWMKKINATHYFKEYFYNPQNEQPHEFKKRKIKELNLDVFIDDNWDIVNYLSEEYKNKNIWWITNFMDRSITYPHKYSSLKQAAIHLQKLIESTS